MHALAAGVPVLQVVMRPQPARWYVTAMLPVLGLAAVALAYFAQRRRLVAIPVTALAGGAALTVLAISGGEQGDNLGVAGLLGGRALEVATIAPLATVPLALLAVAVLVVVLVRAANASTAAGSPYPKPSRTLR